jgi:hypothetical protein
MMMSIYSNFFAVFQFKSDSVLYFDVVQHLTLKISPRQRSSLVPVVAASLNKNPNRRDGLTVMARCKCENKREDARK